MFSTFLRHPFFSYVFVFHDRRPKTERAVERAAQPDKEKKRNNFLCLFWLFSCKPCLGCRRRRNVRKKPWAKALIRWAKIFFRFSFFLPARLYVCEEQFYNKEKSSGKSWRILTTQLALFSQLLKLKKAFEKKEAFLSVAALDIYLFMCWWKI